MTNNSGVKTMSRARDILINDIMSKAELIQPLDENNILRVIIEDRDNNTILTDSYDNQ